MKICFPVSKNEGLESRVFGHFSSAPKFVVVDTGTRQVMEILNRDRRHEHGACRPLKALGGNAFDAIVVAGIGSGALSGLTRAGLTVYMAQGATISENVEKFEKGELEEYSHFNVCAEHRHGHGHGGYDCGF